MKKRAKVCFYIFVICAFFALGILGYFIFNPSNDNVMVGSKKFVTFNEVPNASVYTLSVKGLEKDNNVEYKAFYKISKNKLEDNKYLFSTEVEIENKKVAEESYIQEIFSEKSEKIDCMIKNYQVTFFNEQGNETETIMFDDQALNDVDKKTLCCVISEYFDSVFVEDGLYHVECLALDANGDVIENSDIEFDYNYEAYYLRDFARRPSFFMNGFTVDYVIDDEEEFKEFVWHAILYRENDITFYCNTSEITENNINSLTINAINDYPEYDGLYDANSYAELNNNVGKLVNFKYYLDFNFTKNYKSLQTLDENTYNLALDELHYKNTNFNVNYIKKEESLERTFPIDSLEQEVLVYNTEQLFMAVLYGAKPVFLSEEDEGYLEDYSIVKTVYNNAREELKKINNSNELSDYVKALNIYRYLCENVVYDYVTYEYMNLKNDFSVYNFGSFNCFYLEGVFLDLNNQYAVCDGLAKAYTLLCRIEGVPCVKVNGTVSGENHAWNKVGLEEANSNQIKWLYVDTTWGVGVEKDEKQEYLTHSYFLFMNTDRLNRELRTPEFVSEIDVSNGSGNNLKPIEISFDYYKNIYYSFENENEEELSGNCYVGDEELPQNLKNKFLLNYEEQQQIIDVFNAELENIFNFVKYKLNLKEENHEEVSYVIEIEFNSSYARNPLSKVYNLITDNNYDENNFLTLFNFDENINMEFYKVTEAKDIVLFRFYK